MAETVHLRGHHLLCILTHVGAGYTPGFIDNLDTQIKRINNGAIVKIVSGPDDVCAALLKAGEEICGHAKVCSQGRVIRIHDQTALMDVAHELQMPALEEGQTLALKKGEISYLREAFADGAVRRACNGCPWHDACTEVAGRNFSGVKLMPEAVPIPLHPLRRAYGRSSLDR